MAGTTRLPTAGEAGTQRRPSGASRHGARPASSVPRIAALIFLLSAVAVGSAAGATGTVLPTVVAAAGPWRPELKAEGRVRPWRGETIAAPLPLSVKAVLAEHGQHVRRGAVLAEVEVPGLTARLQGLAQAEEEVALAREQVRNAERRLAERVATRQDVLQAKIALARGRGKASDAWGAAEEALLALGSSPSRASISAKLRSAPAQVVAREYSRVRAPFSGRVAERYVVAAGARVQEGAPLFLLEDFSQVYVGVEVPPSQLQEWRRGSAGITLASGEPLALRPASASVSVDPATGLAVLPYLAANPGGRLLGGQWVRVRLLGPTRRVAWVPEAAVVARRGNTYCIVEQDGGYAPALVATGTAQGGRVPILKGIDPGQRVVTEGAYELLYRDLTELMTPSD